MFKSWSTSLILRGVLAVTLHSVMADAA